MRRLWFSRLVWLACLPLGILARSWAGQVPDGFVVETLATNLNAATAMAIAPDGRILIADQTGPLRVWKNGRLLPKPALDLTGRVDDFWERGLLGVTFHPDFPHTPHLFVVYVAKEPFTHHVISRFTLMGDAVDPASEFILLEGDDQRTLGGTVAAGHQGGPIRFGADGKLYVALGEQTAGEPAQSLTTLQGKVLRLNVDGSVPEDNPFLAQTTGKYRAIWAYGIRNVFGLAVQGGTGRLFFTDVGGTAYDEVNELVRGANYGWPRAEGFSTNSAFRNPLYAYPPAVGRSVVGAAFYPREISGRENAALFPEPWRGKLFFADWAANWVKALALDEPTNAVTFARGLNAPATIEIAPDGSLLVLNRGTLWRDGKKWQPHTGSLVRIRYGGIGSAPSPPATPFPRALSASGFFRSLAPLEPRGGFVEFDVIHPPWQPGAITRRWISLPPQAALRINKEGEFEFPAGTVVVQHHIVANTKAPFETHLMWFDVEPAHSRVARAAAYRWSTGSEAVLIEDGEVRPLPADGAHRWYSPGAETRLDLDTVVVGFHLPLSPRQLSADTLADWSAREWIKPRLEERQIASLARLVPLAEERAPLELRVRSFLDVHCASCHRPGGPSRGNFDARFITPANEQGLIGGDLIAGDLGVSGARVVVPSHPEKSILFLRLLRNDAFRMPPVALYDEPPPVLSVLQDWIRSLPSPRQ